MFIEILELMSSRDSKVFPHALRLVSQFFSVDNVKLIDLGLQNDALQKFEALLNSSETTIMMESLWGLSNITASAPH